MHLVLVKAEKGICCICIGQTSAARIGGYLDTLSYRGSLSYEDEDADGGPGGIFHI